MMLICTDWTFGARYNDLLAAQHSFQNVFMYLLFFEKGSLWLFNRNFSYTLMKTNNIACPCHYTDGVLCSRDCEFWSETCADDKVSATERG